MQASLLHELVSRRFSIRARWEALLRAEPVTTPLGLPDALVHLIDTTLEEIFVALENSGKQSAAHRDDLSSAGPLCPCGRNPYLAYFIAADQAMREALILSQAASSPLDPVQRDASLDEVNQALKQISRHEVEAFCGVCQFRHLALEAPVETLAIHGG
jgi:hypothetical protein